MSLRRLGEVVRTAQGLAVVRCPDEDRPDIGIEAVDESLSAVGRVVDVFGPVEQPYLAVSPAGDATPDRLVGTTLYAR
ncbi:MAG: H/ACA ribonucleoprotein complex subunit GAR1 [Halolamina sp.]